MTSRIHFSQKSVPIALLFLTAIGFAPLISSLGFYWDDWPSIWYLHFWGPQSFHQSFAVDRPLLGWLFHLTTSVLGESTIAWQIFGILTRWLTTLAFWWVLRLLWPDHLTQVTWAAFLFALYPGFKQQYIAVTYSNAFVIYALFLLSFALMILAIQKPRFYWLLMLASIVTSGFSMFVAEYFFGLELLRPLVLWFLKKGRVIDKRGLARKIAWQWLPYLALMLLFLVWRVFLHETPRGEITLFDQLVANPLAGVFSLVGTIVNDIFEVSALAWIQMVDRGRIMMMNRSGTLPLYIGIIILGFLFSIFFLTRLRLKAQHNDHLSSSSKSWGIQACLAGAAALLVGGWPFWVTNLQLELFFPRDRFTLPMMIGAALLLAGIIALLNRPLLQSAILVALFTGFAAGMHYEDALQYRQEWLLLKNWFWQMSWRAPQIEPGTTILSSDLYLDYYSDNSLTAPLNWTYAPEKTSLEIPYLFMDIEARLGVDLGSLEPDTPVFNQNRTTTFRGNTSQSLVVFFAPPRCVKVIHPDDDRHLPYKPEYLSEAIPLSAPAALIRDTSQPAHPPLNIFGEEPAHGWCYYFEKAELAAQLEEWEMITGFADQAFSFKQSFDRETASELNPFIRAFAHTGQWDTAYQLTQQAFQASNKMQNMLCYTWADLVSETKLSPARTEAISQVNSLLACKINP